MTQTTKSKRDVYQTFSINQFLWDPRTRILHAETGDLSENPDFLVNTDFLVQGNRHTLHFTLDKREQREPGIFIFSVVNDDAPEELRDIKVRYYSRYFDNCKRPRVV